MSKKFRVFKVALFLVLVATMLTGCFGIFSKEWTVEGVVKDEDGNPIKGATIILEYAKKSAKTESDEEGKWSAKVSGDSVKITVNKLGYEFEPAELTVKKDDKKAIEFVGTGTGELVISPKPGEYVDSVTVSLYIVGNYTIFYTLDGSEPTADSIEYKEQFTLTETTTVKAIAIHNEDESNTTDVVEATFEIVKRDLVKNGGFESGKDEFWVARGDAIITVDDQEANSGKYSLHVTNRADIADGPEQHIDSFEEGQTYNISFSVLYKEGPEERRFNMSYQDGDWTTIFNLISGVAKRGEWTTISETHTLVGKIGEDGEPQGVELNDPVIFIETSWVQDPTKENDWMDFWVDDISITIAD